MMLLDMNKNMSAKDWRTWVRLLRDKASKIDGKDERSLFQELVLLVARKLARQNATMTAQTLVALLYEVDQLRSNNQKYSEACRGPCSRMRGVYNAFANAGRGDDASVVARAFKTVRGTYAYE